jgi:hypothetical protein
VVKQQGKLRVYNRIYASVFNSSWVDEALAEADLLPIPGKTLLPITLASREVKFGF